jgi:hypothetical protein
VNAGHRSVHDSINSIVAGLLVCLSDLHCFRRAVLGSTRPQAAEAGRLESIQVLCVIAVKGGMTKFFDKEIAANIGHVAALEIAALGAQLHAEIESINAVRKAQGRPSLEDEEERDRAEFAELMDEFGEEGFVRI